MAQHQRTKIARQPDTVVLNALSKLGTTFNVTHFSVKPYGVYSDVSMPLNGELPDALRNSITNKTLAIWHFQLSVNGMTIQVYRGGQPNGDQFTPSPLYDELVITPTGQGQLDPATVIVAIDTLQRQLKVFDPRKTSDLASGEGLEQLNAVHSATLDRLEQLASKVVEDYDARRNALEEDFQQRRLAAEKEIEAVREKINADATAEQALLDDQAAQLENRRKALDDKDNTHARRGIQRQLVEELKERQRTFSLTQGTNDLRSPVRWSLLALIGLFVCSVLFSGLKLSSHTDYANLSQLGILVGHLALSSIALTLSILFFSRWQNKWAERHADTEFASKQFALDIERASWLVETALEWRDKNGTKMPDELIKSLSLNLFANSQHASDDPLKHPADQLASALFGAANKATLRVGQSTVELDPKKLRKQTIATETPTQ